MTRRDLFWRSAGAVMVGAGYLATLAATDAGGAADIVGLAGIFMAAAGLLFILGGKRVVLALRVERSRHRELPSVIHASRRSRRSGR